MEHQLTNVEIINELIKKSPYGIALSKFNDINSRVHNDTVVSMILQLRHFDNRIAEKFGRSIVYSALRINICKILLHPDIDFSIDQNKSTLAYMMFGGNKKIYMDIETVETILKCHKLNPDNIIKNNSVAKFMAKNFYHPQYVEMISMLIKYGANIELNCSFFSCVQQPYIMGHNNMNALEIILSNTTNFYDLGNMFNIGMTRTFTDNHFKIIFDHILMHGKISSLQYLDKKEYENIRKFEEWLQNIQKLSADIDLMRTIFTEPIKAFNLTDKDQYTDSTVRKMCIFRQNLQCLTKSKITVPAYKYYHIAIIILFMINNPRVIVLSRDVLRKIASFVFNY
uniref:Ankyrin repeat protein n=1 Tax=viral metagenome TaxID=1070528 RepID=A0A6C0C6R5_9ZZZZ